MRHGSYTDKRLWVREMASSRTVRLDLSLSANRNGIPYRIQASTSRRRTDALTRLVMSTAFRWKKDNRNQPRMQANLCRTCNKLVGCISAPPLLRVLRVLPHSSHRGTETQRSSYRPQNGTEGDAL